MSLSVDHVSVTQIMLKEFDSSKEDLEASRSLNLYSY